MTFSVISALASSISSRTSSEARSETSWIAWPSSDVECSSGMSVHQPLQDAGEDEGAGEGGADQDLGTVGAGRRRRGRALRRGAARGGGRGVRVGAAADARGRDARAGDARRRAAAAPARRSRGACARPRRPRRAPARPRARPASACSCAFCSLRESFSLRSVASSTASCASAVSSSARRASVAASSLRSSAPRASARSRSAACSACAAAAARVASSAGVVFCSSVTPADLPRTRGGKSRPRGGW